MNVLVEVCGGYLACINADICLVALLLSSMITYHYHYSTLPKTQNFSQSMHKQIEVDLDSLVVAKSLFLCSR